MKSFRARIPPGKKGIGYSTNTLFGVTVSSGAVVLLCALAVIASRHKSANNKVFFILFFV
jgi:hypothetical protein